MHVDSTLLVLSIEKLVTGVSLIVVEFVLSPIVLLVLLYIYILLNNILYKRRKKSSTEHVYYYYPLYPLHGLIM